MRTLSALPSVGRDHAFSLFHLDSHRGPIMTFNKIIRISKHPPKADKSAVGAINRPLQMCMDYPHRRVVTVRTSCSNQAVMYSSFHRSLAIRCAGTYPLTMWVIHTHSLRSVSTPRSISRPMQPDPSLRLRVTRERCHAARSEASRGPCRQTLRYAQGDKKGPPSLSGILDLCLRLMHISAGLSAPGGFSAIQMNP